MLEGVGSGQVRVGGLLLRRGVYGAQCRVAPHHEFNNAAQPEDVKVAATSLKIKDDEFDGIQLENLRGDDIENELETSSFDSNEMPTMDTMPSKSPTNGSPTDEPTNVPSRPPRDQGGYGYMADDCEYACDVIEYLLHFRGESDDATKAKLQISMFIDDEDVAEGSAKQQNSAPGSENLRQNLQLYQTMARTEDRTTGSIHQHILTCCIAANAQAVNASPHSQPQLDATVTKTDATPQTVRRFVHRPHAQRATISSCRRNMWHWRRKYRRWARTSRRDNRNTDCTRTSAA